ncbi:FIG01230870: hypothetical protein [hydrothermal vent metagenome]|uniref:BioF2-like acetyltransferase domain-containing protein n=1 Tax=hydrothermal vent metagenome TaxID=652676 RepID=A0A3B0XJ75_9ZZZZ
MLTGYRPPVAGAVSPADEYVSVFYKKTETMISNVKTEVGCCQIGDVVLPVTINETEYENSYVCSPYTALIPYCLDELKKLNNWWLRKGIEKLIFIFDKVLKKHNINRVIHVNNWLLSTNLYPEKNKIINVSSLIENITDQYKGHTVIFRSLNNFLNKALISEFELAGCMIVPTRQVYIYDKLLNDYSKTHNYKIDKKHMDKTKYQYVKQSDINESDYARIVELYNMLYVSKYSKHNPQFTTQYIALIIKHPSFYLEGFRNVYGVLDAVGGRFAVENTITLPIVGYDTSKPIKVGLYRLVLMSTLLYAEKNNYCFNASSGAPHFKKLRGGVPCIEYSAIYIKHLPVCSQRIWKVLNYIMRKLFVPIMKKYQL